MEKRRHSQIKSRNVTEVPASFLDKNYWKRVSTFQLIYSIAGLLLGLICVIGGLFLFLKGTTGSTKWAAKLTGVETNLSDAAPGAVLFVVGLLIVWLTRFTIKVRK